MKILFLTPRIPFPPLKGDQAVAYHRLRTLGGRHEITLLTLVDGHEPAESEEELGKFCRRIIKISHPPSRAVWNVLSRGAFSELPFQVLYYRSPAFEDALDLLLKEHFDIVHCFMLRMVPYLKRVSSPVVLECIDSMQLNISRQLPVVSLLKRLLYREEFKRLVTYEPSVDRFVSRTVFVSPIDSKVSGSAKAIVLPLGVVVPPYASSLIEKIVVFSGNMSYAPNIQAVEWFVKKCWKMIKDAVPGAVFRVIGGGAGDSIMKLRSLPGVEVVGRVEDMLEELGKATVSVAPMQSGSGMQFKILEAMVCGLPVVTTTLGLGAIAARVGEDILVEDDEIAFSRVVIDLFDDNERRQKIGVNARTFIIENHSWERATCLIEEDYRLLLASIEQ